MKTGLLGRVASYVGPVVWCLALGALASLLQQDALEIWYPLLRKSPLTPPGYVFPIAWTLLYVLIGIAFGAVWNGVRHGRPARSRGLLVAWGVQCVLNFMWSVCFFYGRMPWAGLVVISLLLVAVFYFLLKARWHSPLAFWCFFPYMLWLLFATYLNLYVCLYN